MKIKILTYEMNNDDKVYYIEYGKSIYEVEPKVLLRIIEDKCKKYFNRCRLVSAEEYAKIEEGTMLFYVLTTLKIS